MIALFPDLETDLAKAIEGLEWAQRIERADDWLEFLMERLIDSRTTGDQHNKLVKLHCALSRAFESRAWAEVDAIIDAMEREFWGD